MANEPQQKECDGNLGRDHSPTQRAGVHIKQLVPETDLNRIAEAGWRAPSAKNRQAWDFVIVTSKEHLQELSTVWRAPVISRGPPRRSRSLSRNRPTSGAE